MSTNVKILADSLSPQGHRVITALWTYPRIIHGEVMTHRQFSRNSASSRAIPFEKMVEMVQNNPFVPIAWQKSHRGMQGTEYWGDNDWVVYQPNVSQYHVKNCSIGDWKQARDNAVSLAKQLHRKNITKQLCNRLLEPFMWHTTLVTATEWENFFELRCPKFYFEPSGTYFRSRKDFVKEWNATFKVGIDISEPATVDSWTYKQWQENFNRSQAEIHIQALAEAMWDAMNESTPTQLKPNQWHIPFVDKMDNNRLRTALLSGKYNDEEEITPCISELMLKIATSRCARLSYLTFDGEIDIDKDIRLHDQLLKDGHMSPFEHCARAMTDTEYNKFIKGYHFGDIDFGMNAEGWCNNLRGFIPYRYLVE